MNSRQAVVMFTGQVDGDRCACGGSDGDGPDFPDLERAVRTKRHRDVEAIDSTLTGAAARERRRQEHHGESFSAHALSAST